jgi:hypothetical protein
MDILIAAVGVLALVGCGNAAGGATVGGQPLADALASVDTSGGAGGVADAGSGGQLDAGAGSSGTVDAGGGVGQCDCGTRKCGALPGCPNICGTCAAGEKCDSGQCVSCCGAAKCGFVQGCQKSCGVCNAGTACKNNQCVKTEPVVQAKYGEFCGPSKDCQAPAQGASQGQVQAYQQCLGQQCETGLCFRNVCTKQCNIGTDKVDNSTGVTGTNAQPDGIEDIGAQSQCDGAADSIYGTSYRCAQMTSDAQVTAGQGVYYCLPGDAFKTCKNSKDCPANQVCWLHFMKGDYSLRCGPKAKSPDGSKGALGTKQCNSNKVAGTIKMCQNALCTTKGCVDFCKTNADCGFKKGDCVMGLCGNGKSCGKDEDCSDWTCLKSQKLAQTSQVTVDLCWPKDSVQGG